MAGGASLQTDVDVYVAMGETNVRAGRLHSHHRLGAESASFAYDEPYLAAPHAYELDPELPLVTGTLETAAGRAMFGAFRDSVPDRWGRMLIERAERAEQARASEAGSSPRPASEFDLLVGVRDDVREGALRFRPDDRSPFLAAADSGVPRLGDLPVLLDLAARAEFGTAGYDELRTLVQAASSLGGARPKAHVLDADGHAAIAKFPSAASDNRDVMAWEQVALDLARDAGMTVADSELIAVGDQHVLIVRRFDRRDGVRVGYASAMTMLMGVYGQQRSYLEIAEVVAKRSPAADGELRELWRRVAFSILISNTDDHLRNHGFLHESGEMWRLSPAFDINPDPRPGPKNLSTAIAFADTRASVDTLMSVAGRFRLDAGDAVEVLGQVTRAVARWRDVAMSHGLKEDDLDAMAPAFEHPEAERARELTGPV